MSGHLVELAGSIHLTWAVVSVPGVCRNMLHGADMQRACYEHAAVSLDRSNDTHVSVDLYSIGTSPVVRRRGFSKTI